MKVRTTKNGTTIIANTAGFVDARLPREDVAYPTKDKISESVSLVGIVGLVTFTPSKLLSGIDANIIEPKKAKTPKNTNSPKIMNESD